MLACTEDSADSPIPGIRACRHASQRCPPWTTYRSSYAWIRSSCAPATHGDGMV